MNQKGLAPILIVLILAVTLVGGYLVYQNQTKPTPQTTIQTTPTPSTIPINEAELIRDACAKKSGIDKSKVIIKIDKPSSDCDGKFASGQYEEVGAAGGAKWFAAKIDNQWICPFILQGPPNCSEIVSYNFPTELLSTCLDDNNNVINR